MNNPGWFTQTDVVNMKSYLCKRIDRLLNNTDHIFSMHEPRWFFYTWFDLSDELEKEEMKSKIIELVSEDIFLIEFLNFFATLQRSSTFDEKMVVNFSDVGMFIDMEDTIERLEEIVKFNHHLEDDVRKILGDYRSR